MYLVQSMLHALYYVLSGEAHFATGHQHGQALLYCHVSIRERCAIPIVVADLVSLNTQYRERLYHCLFANVAVFLRTRNSLTAIVVVADFAKFALAFVAVYRPCG